MEDKEAIEIYKELSKVNTKITVDVASKLDNVATNLKDMNDVNILHQQNVMAILKLMSNRYFKLIVALVMIVAVIAIGEKAIDIFKAFII